MALTIIENFQDANMVTEVSLTRETVNKICRDVIEAMKNGLKEEARSIEVFEYILQESGSMLKSCRGYRTDSHDFKEVKEVECVDKTIEAMSEWIQNKLEGSAHTVDEWEGIAKIAKALAELVSARS